MGSDAVCSIQWMEKLGPVIMDHKALTMKFNLECRPICLTGMSPITEPVPISVQLFRRLHTTESITNFLYLHLQPTYCATEHQPLHHDNPQLCKLLSSYNHVFSQPKTLPTTRTLNHHINLIPNSEPINTKPYCYPCFQKNEIERQIQEMLHSSIIQPSTSPFSSPILLVKKYGSWRICVDYRALNAITINDRFPIPTVDELLDELCGAIFFFKIGSTKWMLPNSYSPTRHTKNRLPYSRGPLRILGHAIRVNQCPIHFSSNNE